MTISKTEKFIQKATNLHKNLYEYSLVTYVNSSSKITIVCKIHGPFEQTPNVHLSGSGCAKCKMGGRKSVLQFVIDAKLKHGNRYDYSKVKYNTNTTKVIIVCPVHGEFEQTPMSHLQGRGCRRCKVSMGENKIKECLESMDIPFEQEKSFDGCSNPITGWKLRFDFYLPEHNILIEYDGSQHFIPYSYGSNQTEAYKKEMLAGIKFRDSVKTDFATKVGIPLIRIPYTHINDIPTIMSKLF